MALPLSQSTTLAPLGILALCGAVAMLFYLKGRLWSKKGKRAQQQTDTCRLALIEDFQTHIYIGFTDKTAGLYT